MKMWMMMMERRTAASAVVLFLLCSCPVTSTDSKEGCDAFAAIGGSFTVPLRHSLQTSEDLRWKHNRTKIFHQRPVKNVVTGKRDDIYENGSLKLLNLRRSSAGIYIPEVYDTKGKLLGNLNSLFLCLVDPVSKPELKIECESSNVKFTCMTAQMPDATLEWFENDKVLPKENKSTLLRVASKVTDSLFRCKVSNPIGSVSSDSRAENCTPSKLFGLDFRIMVSILAAMGGLAVLLIIILIVCCVRGMREKRKRLQEEEELRLGWANSEPQQHQCHQPPNQLQPAGHTGPRQHRGRKRGGPQHLRSQPQPSPKRAAQASRPTANYERPPPVPQPRKTVAAQRL